MKITTPLNNGFLLDGRVVRPDWQRMFTEQNKRLNGAESVTTLSVDGVTISNPPTQTEVQSLAAKIDELLNALK